MPVVNPEREWCYALDDLLSALSQCPQLGRERSLDVFLLVVGSYANKAHPDAAPLWERKGGGGLWELLRDCWRGNRSLLRVGLANLFGQTTDGLYRVDRTDLLNDVVTDTAEYGHAILFGIPSHAVSGIQAAARTMADRRRLPLSQFLVPGTPYFEIRLTTDGCDFSARYSLECPKEIREILDTAMRNRPSQISIFDVP